MNPRAEFVKAIMSVLRLESNIYTTGAIETIIDRLEIKDYQLFIAYLGERKADYEKPIESIAKGVEEFYQRKLNPHRDEAKKVHSEISQHLYSVRNHCESQAEHEVNMQKVEEEVQKDYGNQSEQIQENNRYLIKNMHINEISNDKYNKFLEYNVDNIFFKRFLIAKTQKPVFTDYILNVIQEVGGLRVVNDGTISTINGSSFMSVSENAILEYFLKGKIKPTIAEQIEIKELEESPLEISHEVRKMLTKND